MYTYTQTCKIISQTYKYINTRESIYIQNHNNPTEQTIYNGNRKIVFGLLYNTKCCHRYLILKLCVHRKL